MSSGLSSSRRYRVKTYVTVVQNRRGQTCRVVRTGDDKFYLFDPLRPDGTSGCIQFPVRKTELRREIASALAHGWGNAGL